MARSAVANPIEVRMKSRRFMPSWDEPDYKATFDLTARVPANQMAVSNMPAAAVHIAPRPARTRTPRRVMSFMSSLLRA